MKRLLFVLIVTLTLSNLEAYAKNANRFLKKITLVESPQREEPISKEIDSPATRSIHSQTANAYLYNNTICIDFNETLPTVTVSIINESTGETIYSEICDAPTDISINLNEESCGNYLIQIESDDVFLYGSFSL